MDASDVSTTLSCSAQQPLPDRLCDVKNLLSRVPAHHNTYFIIRIQLNLLNHVDLDPFEL